MTSTNVARACKGVGRKAVCLSGTDSNCIDVTNGDNVLTTLYNKLCRINNISPCTQLANVFVYWKYGKNNFDDASCGVYSGGDSWCNHGNRVSDAYALCASRGDFV